MPKGREQGTFRQVKHIFSVSLLVIDGYSWDVGSGRALRHEICNCAGPQSITTSLPPSNGKAPRETDEWVPSVETTWESSVLNKAEKATAGTEPISVEALPTVDNVLQEQHAVNRSQLPRRKRRPQGNKIRWALRKRGQGYCPSDDLEASDSETEGSRIEIISQQLLCEQYPAKNHQ